MCQNIQNGKVLPEKDCNLTQKPSHISQCERKIECENFVRNLMSKVEETSMAGIIYYTNWSKCSVKCGSGYRTREAICKSPKNHSVQIPLSYCNIENLEKLKIKCHLVNCTYKLIEKWSKCSTCGQQGKLISNHLLKFIFKIMITFKLFVKGVETLERQCQEITTKTFVSLTNCDINKLNTNVTRSCNKPCTRHVIYTYEWRAGLWGKV